MLVGCSRMAAEYRKYTTSYHSQFAHHTYIPKHAYSSESPLPRHIPVLLQIHFMRKIVDEGHGLTGGSHVPDVLSMASLVQAERRWVLTGTPTTIPVLSLKTLAQTQTSTLEGGVAVAVTAAEKAVDTGDTGVGSAAERPVVGGAAVTVAGPRTLCGVESADFHTFASHLYRVSVCPYVPRLFCRSLIV